MTTYSNYVAAVNLRRQAEKSLGVTSIAAESMREIEQYWWLRWGNDPVSLVPEDTILKHVKEAEREMRKDVRRR